ncbi:PepSY-associated TM helix domain-containing protein [Azospirillum sp. ST 5-10]|uniref:PepSY-associated TM helix domain-containing protein n=1 Tax=unclassified Azospirillum TaxID=2630922 RepID=UPI003F49BA28
MPSQSTSARLLSIHRLLSLVFCLLISWSLWTGLLAFYADFVRPWTMPGLAEAAGRPPPTVVEALGAVAARHALGTEWTMMAPTPLRDFYIFSGRFGDGRPLTNLMVNPATDVMAPWNSVLTDSLFRRIHTDLLLPKPFGRFLMGLAGILIVLLVGTGLFIHGKVIVEAWSWRRRSRLIDLSDAHKRFGFWLIPYLFLMGASGGILGLKVASQPLDALLQAGGSAEAARTLLGEDGEDGEDGAIGRSVTATVPGGLALCVDRFAQRFPDSRIGRLQRHDDRLTVEGVPRGRLTWAGEGAGSLRAECDLADGTIGTVRDSRDGGWGGVVESALRPLHYARFGGTGTVLVYCLLGVLCLWIVDSGMKLLWLRAEKEERRGADRLPVSRRLFQANNALYLLLPLLLLADNLLSGTTHGGVAFALSAVAVLFYLLPWLDGIRPAVERGLLLALAAAYAGLPLLRLAIHPGAPWLGVASVMVVDATALLMAGWLVAVAAGRARRSGTVPQGEAA